MKFSTHSFEDEIMSTGVWNGVAITPKILLDMFRNFSSLKDVVKVPLKLGHDPRQPLTDGLPALGWVDGLRLDDMVNPTKLFANYVDMPEIVYKAIKARMYTSRSLEMEDQMRSGKRVNNILTAVALLGTTIPAVKNLRDLGKFLASEGDYSDNDLKSYVIDCSRDTSITVDNQKCFSININEKESTMTPEEEAKLRADLAASNLKASELETANVTLIGANKQFSEDNTAREEATKVANIKTKRDDIKSLFETAVKDEVITPAQRETFSKLLGVDDDVRVVGIELDAVKTLIGDDKSTMFSQKSTAHDEANGDHSGMSPDEVLSEKTFAHMEKTGSEDFTKSLNIVMKANPKLAEDYKLSNGVYE